MSPSEAIGRLERVLKHHPDAEVKNLCRLHADFSFHTVAICMALTALVEGLADRKLVFLVEAEIAPLGRRAIPEDLVAWIEGVGVLVVEVKSHLITGIRQFENNVPQVVYEGKQAADKDLLDQPRKFAYDLFGVLSQAFDARDVELPPIYFAGWLPNVSPTDVASRGAEVAADKVWLSDVLNPAVLLARLPQMKNIGQKNTGRETLELFAGVFGISSGLREQRSRRPYAPATMGQLIDQRTRELKVLTPEQEELAFSPNIVRGPKVIRGVAGSGKTVVLANAVAETLLRAMGRIRSNSLFQDAAERKPPLILVLCYNRVLVPYIQNLIRCCFEARRPDGTFLLPSARLTVTNIDRFAFNLASRVGLSYEPGRPNEPQKMISGLLEKGVPNRGSYDHVFVDEGQDLDLQWFPLIRELAKSHSEDGPSIVVFYDDAQNLYGRKRPGTGGSPPWRDLLGFPVNNRGLSTVMKVGHRNTNQILSFSFNLLLGAFAQLNPEMATFAGLAEYEKETIPTDPRVGHPNAGRPCVERIGPRQYRINFAVSNGPKPAVHVHPDAESLLNALVAELRRVLDTKLCGVDASDILVMAPSHEHVCRIRDACISASIPVHCPVRLKNVPDARDVGLFVRDRITVSTIKAAKGYTAHVCHVAFVDALDAPEYSKERRQQERAQLHVACTRATIYLDLWCLASPMGNELEDALSSIM